jgi:signal transduction histidine kinase
MTDSAMRLVGALVAAVLAIAAVTVASLRSLAARRESSGWVLHTQDVRLSLERVLSLATDAESTQRAYLLTGREEYLQPFAAASASVVGEVDTLGSLTRDNPRQQQRVDSLRRLLDAKAAALHRAIELRRAGESGGPASVASGEAGLRMQGVRVLVAEMAGEESALLRQRLDRLSSAELWSAAVVIGGAALLLILTAVAAVMVRGDLRRRKEQVAERARVAEYQERLISIVGHDLRNPLTALLVSAQMLLQKREDLKPRHAVAVDRIQRSAARIDALVAQLIDFTYARLGRGIPTRPSPMDAKAVVARAADAVRDRYPGRDIRVDAPEQTLLGSWDGDRVAQLVENLVTNALQYGADGPVAISLARAADESLELHVHNAGPAIPAEIRERLFDAYWRGKGAEVSHPRGLGMGLYIVREIARAHGGAVEVRSADGDGTTFTVRLPARGPAPGGSPGATGNATLEVPVA